MIAILTSLMLFASDSLQKDAVSEIRWFPNYVTAEDSIQDDCMRLNRIYVDRGGYYLMGLGSRPVCGKTFKVRTEAGRTYASQNIYGMSSTFEGAEYVTVDDKGRPVLNTGKELTETKPE